LFEPVHALAEFVIVLPELVLLLLKVVVGGADEGMRVLELAVELFPFLRVLALDVHGEAFGHKLNIMP